MVISGYVIDAVVDGGNKRRMVLIISDNFPISRPTSCMVWAAAAPN